MNSTPYPPVGEMIADRRTELGLSGYELARRTGIRASTILRIERGDTQPSTEKLDILAGALGINPSQLLAAAGYDQLAELPTFTPYLRSKYPDMTNEARAELEQAFSRIAKKHGFDPTRTGPQPGEDE